VDVQISEMATADYAEVLALWRSTEGVGLNEAATAEIVHSYLVRNPGLNLVARHAGRIVGAVLCGHDGRRGYLHHLALAGPFRRHGIGKLIEQCLAKLGNLGIQKCNIFLYADNEPGERFWKNSGWVERSELKVLTKEIRAVTSPVAAE
jgi:N-acetylglutamate synthase